MANISAIKLPNGNTYNLVDKTSGYVTTDTKNTTGSKQPVGTRQKLYLIGASYQSAYAETYSYSDTYVDNDGTLHINGALAIKANDNYVGVFAPIESFTTNRVYGLPNKAGTIALTSDIPTVNNATLTIQKNGTTVNSFTANASSDVTANITVPTKVSDLTNDSGFVTTDTKHTAGITEVSSSQIQGGIYLIGTDTPPTSGSEYSRTYTYPSKLYVDSGSGLHTPTGLVIHDPYSNYKVAFAHDTLTENRTYVFPNKTGYVALTSDIKDATLTIQKNGVNIQTFTANASSNKTANIVVNEVPSGGTTGQALVKNSATNYDVSWVDVSGAYIVTFTYDNQNETWSCDKTAQEIYEACESGKIAIGICDNSVFPCKYFSDDGEGDGIHYYSATFTSSMYYGYSNTLIADEFYIENSEVERNTYFADPVSQSRKINNKPLSSDITLTASDVGALPDTTTIPSKTSDLTNDSGFITGMTILSYGSSTWQNFIDAYNANKVVYCRASSNSNPASGSQTRLAFMAYVNNATTPTEVEFQYYRSVSTHTASQQGDQVYVYKLNKTNGWSVTVREASVKVVAGTGLGGTYSNGTMTLTGPTKVSDLTNDSGFITGYTETDPVFGASAAAGITSSNISSWNGKQDALVSGTNIKTINNQSLLGSGNITVSTTAAQIIRWTEST